MDAFDVIIVGTGAGGGTLARQLAPSGKRILLLERGDWLPREPENWVATNVFVDNRYVSPETWYDPDGQGVPAADPLLRRRRDEALRRRALPACARRTSASFATTTASRRRGRSRTTSSSRTTRRPSRRTRCTVPAARTRPSRRPARPYPFPARVARAADPAARGRSRGGRLPPVPRAVRRSAERGEHAVQRLRALHELRRRSRARCTGSRTPRCSAFVRRSSIRTSRCSRTPGRSSSRRTRREPP